MEAARSQQADPAPPRSFSTGPSFSQSQIIPYHHRQPDISASPKPVRSKSTSSVPPWSLDDPETKRRRRVASYKAYTVEGRMKSSLRKSVRWFKNKYLEMRYGWW